MTGPTKASGGDRRLALAFIAITAFVLFVVSIVPYLGSYLLLDMRGASATATLENVSESISTSDDGVWARTFNVTARDGADARLVRLLVHRGVFDALAVGDTIAIRRHTGPWAAALSRVEAEIAGQTWRDRLRTWSEEAWPLFHVLWSGWAGLALLWLFGRGGGAGCLVPLVYAVAWLTYWLSPLSDEVPRGRIARATGTVVSVTRATKMGDTEDSGGFPVVARYQMAVVQFTPAGARHPVRALDRLDADSLPSLRKENPVEVEYQIDAPRNARIVGGRRTYWWKNLFFWWPYAAAIAVGILVWHIARWRWPWLTGSRSRPAP
jgi:hypothetical protein